MKQVNDPVLAEHETGDRHCKKCTDGYPKRCPDCGNLLHGELEQIEDNGQVLVTECESCHGHAD